jgi:hypothetical protein
VARSETGHNAEHRARPQRKESFSGTEPKSLTSLIKCYTMRQVLLCLCAFLSVPAAAFGDIIVDVQDASISAGGTGFIDVLISSTGTDNLYLTSYHFEITGSVANGELQFRPNAFQTNVQQSVVAPVPYVFSGDTNSGNFFANRQDPTLTQIIGGDSTLSGTGISLTSTQALLARLQVEHITGTPLAAVGDAFTVKLINDDNGTPVDFTDDSTYFLDDSLNNLAIDPLSYSGSGTITITSAAVPEPSTFGVLGFASIAFIGKRWRRRSHRIDVV